VPRTRSGSAWQTVNTEGLGRPSIVTALGHALEHRRLRLRRGAVDLVSEGRSRRRSAPSARGSCRLHVEDVHADEVRRHGRASSGCLERAAERRRDRST
jgi:hypothetical protein